jgi:hypothetical protein
VKRGGGCSPISCVKGVWAALGRKSEQLQYCSSCAVFACQPYRKNLSTDFSALPVNKRFETRRNGSLLCRTLSFITATGRWPHTRSRMAETKSKREVNPVAEMENWKVRLPHACLPE